MKTRLAVNLGIEFAESFHLRSARAVAAVAACAGQLGNIQGYYAVAETEALNHSFWLDLPCLWQGECGLGERMAHVYRTLLERHDFVLLTGADIPQMTVSQLLNASDWLADDEAARFAFGPSFDGGFWLFGGNCSLPDEFWTQVTYSTADTGSQFLSKIEQLGNVLLLLTLRDVDEPDDLIALRKTLQELKEPLPEQQALIRFLDSVPV
ncbi:MAG: DUF2064 domain-containing protein [Methylobacter sp.]|nr:DUF2064 domain-containing protein [Methylobacter sp.]